MPLFTIKNSKLLPIEKSNFSLEKQLQELIEENLEIAFNCRLIASEFTTSVHHTGRIDSLALSEENHPVIIEYKKIASSELINQSLFYLHWLQDHQGDFEIAARKKLGETDIDWSDIRVICIAPDYKKWDIDAVQTMGQKIELWKYYLFKNDSLYLEQELYTSKDNTKTNTKAGTEKNGGSTTEIYSLSDHFGGKTEVSLDLLNNVRSFITDLSSSIKEIPKKHYVAYKASHNIVCLRVAAKNIVLWLKLRPSEIKQPRPKNFRDCTKIGHWGTGDCEFKISSQEEFDEIKEYIELAYNKSGG